MPATAETGRPGYSRTEVEIAEWRDGRTPDDGPPDCARTIVSWETPQGRPVIREKQIERLEARYRRKLRTGEI